MIRLAASIILAAALAGAPASGQTLRPAVTATSSVLHLGDLFANSGDHASDPVAPAPPAGMRITYGSDWLADVAREHGLAWTPGSPFDRVTIERASRDIGSDTLAQQMMNEIATREPVTDADLELDNPGLHLVVPAEAPNSIAIDGLAIDRRTGRVSAIVSAPAGDPAATRQRITGRLVFHVDVPVLNRPIAAGATISADDLGTLKVRRDRLSADVASDPQQIIGKTPRRPLETGTPLRLGDLERPLLVHKGELVTILLTTANLQLTAQGKALEDGPMNALVHVANTKSDLVVDATVLAAGTVGVTMPGGSPQRTAQR